jgi:hypothetical protein
VYYRFYSLDWLSVELIFASNSFFSFYFNGGHWHSKLSHPQPFCPQDVQMRWLKHVRVQQYVSQHVPHSKMMGFSCSGW